MKRLDSNVGSTKAALQERPEIFQTVRVNSPINVSLRMVHKLVNETIIEALVSDRVVAIDPRTVLHVLQDLVLQCLALHIGNDCGANLAKVAVKDALHYGLAAVNS